MLYMPRLTVLVSIEADRPGAWFPGPLGPCQAWFPEILLSRDFKRAKVPVNPMKTPFCFECKVKNGEHMRLFEGQIQKKNYFRK